MAQKPKYSCESGHTLVLRGQEVLVRQAFGMRGPGACRAFLYPTGIRVSSDSTEYRGVPFGAHLDRHAGAPQGGVFTAQSPFGPTHFQLTEFGRTVASLVEDFVIPTPTARDKREDHVQWDSTRGVWQTWTKTHGWRDA